MGEKEKRLKAINDKVPNAAGDMSLAAIKTLREDVKWFKERGRE